MNFRIGRLVGGTFTLGTEPSWEWARNEGGYDKGRDFFSVHWEVQERDPNAIRLHVEAPKQAVDRSLNAIKQRLVSILISADLQTAAENAGYEYRRGSKVSVESIQTNKSTEAFRLIVAPRRRETRADADIENVHTVFKRHITNAIAEVADALEQAFR